MKSLTLVVDMINGFIKEGALADPKSASIVPFIISFLEKDKSERIFLVDRHTENSAEMSIYPPHCINEIESEIIDELKHYCSRIIYKNSTEGFFALKNEIDLDFYDEIIVMGVCTDICILQLVLALKGYYLEKNKKVNIKVLRDGVSTYDALNHNRDEFQNFSLKLMENAGVELV